MKTSNLSTTEKSRILRHHLECSSFSDLAEHSSVEAADAVVDILRKYGDGYAFQVAAFNAKTKSHYDCRQGRDGFIKTESYENFPVFADVKIFKAWTPKEANTQTSSTVQSSTFETDDDIPF